ncbi:MAG: GGDEF domain-containing protein, partial [Gordonia sp. (in: high G+C Gram-positive bacteria)]
LARLTLTDDLTGLPNIRAFRQVLATWLAAPGDHPIVLAILDIDEFKAHNDRWGHPEGDRCLARVGAWLQASTDPAHELVARMAGDEFLLLWHGMSAADARVRAEELRRGLGRLEVLPAAPQVRITASVGIAETDRALVADGDVSALFERADRALYTAKRAGRDRLAGQWRGAAAGPADGNLARFAETPADPAAGPRRFTRAEEAAFRNHSVWTGRPARRFILDCVVAFCVFVLIAQSTFLNVPADIVEANLITVLGGLLPATVLSYAANVLQSWWRWAVGVHIGCSVAMIGALLAEEVVMASNARGIIPFLFVVAVVLNLCVSQIRWGILAVLIPVLLVAITAVRLSLHHLDVHLVYELLILWLVALAAMTFSLRTEQVARRRWASSMELARLSRIDPTTQLPNRRWFDAELSAAVRSADGSVRALMLIDIDLFKRYNDEFGHLAGDDCLRRVGGVLKQLPEVAGCCAARIGGEEFGVVLTGPDRPDLVARAQAIVDDVRCLWIPAPDGRVVTVSAGLAFLTGAGVRETMVAADRALYAAKRAGRDRLVVDTEVTTTPAPWAVVGGAGGLGPAQTA